jgi:hypothetical protein
VSEDPETHPWTVPLELKKNMQAHTNAISKLNQYRDDEAGMLRMLKEEGGNVIAHLKSSPRSFTAYCRIFSSAVMRALIDGGVNPLHIDKISDEATCLGQAVLNPDPQVVGILLQAGCNPYGPYRNDDRQAHSTLEGCVMGSFPTQFNLLDQMHEQNPKVIHEDAFKNLVLRHPKGIAWMEQKQLREATVDVGRHQRSMRL